MGFFTSTNTVTEQVHFNARMQLKNDLLQKEVEIVNALNESNGKVIETFAPQIEGLQKLSELVGELQGVEMNSDLRLKIMKQTTDVITQNQTILEAFESYQGLNSKLMLEVNSLTTEVKSLLAEYERKFK